MEGETDAKSPTPKSGKSIVAKSNSVDSSQLPEKRPLSLIYFDEKEGFKVSDEAVQFLTSIKEKIGVIVVAGKYRTGKSFLLNRIILNKIGEGFGVGPTINPCTKGLWVWNELIETDYNGEKLKVLIVDSEGIGAYDEDQNHDTKIFLFALLLSSYFVYNSMGTIDENAINNLSLIINLSKNLHVQSDTVHDEDPDELAKYFPRFLWVLRDFSLQLRDEYDNPISSKEYFENALKPQKGSSEKIESRNRIRRLITHFFTDRDCATLVRPTEEETDLQALQTLQDDALRPEFVEAANKLRNKIFKRVKPKTLNGKFITGEMLLELCHSYTKAINQGSVPSIKSAWSYVCENECQRAIQESIAAYEISMKEFLAEAKHKADILVLQEGEEMVREQALRIFKQKAVGGDTEQFEKLMRKEINKKYAEIKHDFNTHCEAILEKQSESRFKEIRRSANIGSSISGKGSNDTEMSIKDQITEFRQSFEENPPYFEGKKSWILEKCLALTLRFAESNNSSEKQENEAKIKILESRLHELESSTDLIREEKEQEIYTLKSKLEQIQYERTDLMTQNKIYEEKLKKFDDEKAKIEAKYEEKLRELSSENDYELHNLSQENEQLADLLKTKEEQYFMSNNKLTKLNALLEQKMEMVESSLKETKEKLEVKEQDYRELSKEAISMRKEYNKLQEEHKKEQKHYQDQLKKLAEKFEKENSEMASKAKSSKKKLTQGELDTYMKSWNKEKELMEKQTGMLKKQLDEQRQLHEDLMQVIKSNEKSKKDAEEVSLKLEEKLEKYKNYKKIVDSAAHIECMHCNKSIVANAFSKHMLTCPPEQDSFMSGSHLPPLHLDLQSMKIVHDTENDYKYSEYTILVNYRSKNYQITKKINLFLTLYDSLETHFPGLALPAVPDLFLAYPDERGLLKEEGVYAYDYSESLEKMLQTFSQNPVIRESVFFKKFLEIDKRFPDEFTNARQKKNALMPKNRMTMGIAQSHSQFDLMPDSYVNTDISPKVNRASAINYRQANTMHNMNSPNGESVDTDDDE